MKKKTYKAYTQDDLYKELTDQGMSPEAAAKETNARMDPSFWQ